MMNCWRVAVSMPACGTASARHRWRAKFSPKSGKIRWRPIAIHRKRRRNSCRPPRTRRNDSAIRYDQLMSVINSIRSQLAPINPEGYPFIGGFALASLVLFWLWPPLGWLGVVATLWCVYFFRDPPRVTPVREGIVVAPADGRVSRLANAVPPKELDLGQRALPRISIFMSVFDCHVNRSPLAGRIERM